MLKILHSHRILRFVLLFATIPTGICAMQAHVQEITCKQDTIGTDSVSRKVELNEVVVKSRRKIHKMDQDVYIPTPLQKKVSVDGYDLLRNMAIPQLDIDAITNETTVKGKAVTFFIDNHIVTNAHDVKQLSPGDIMKVEYDAMPTGESRS